MRMLYIDIDCQRPDHLGCYGYHRNTSPNIDRIAAEGVRFENVYVSDAPCLPARTALFSGRFGTHTGVVGHGGTAAEMFIEGPSRGFSSKLNMTSWMRCMRDLGVYTATVTPFGERHSAFHFYSNFNEVRNTGRRGLELGDEIAAVAIDWIEHNAGRENWFLHVTFWDPHTPYRAPEDFGEPFANDPLPEWLTEEVRQAHWQSYGPHSAREAVGFDSDPAKYPPGYPRQPLSIDSMDAMRQLIDGYDTGVLYADKQVGDLVDALEKAGVASDTVLMVSGDHGEALGELNVYGDHQNADEHTTHVPLILKWPGVTDDQAGRADGALHYQFDVAATVVELAGGAVPESWDGESFASAFRGARDEGRDHLVLTQGAWTCERSVRFRDGERELICIRVMHDGYHPYPEHMLFDLSADPHAQQNLAAKEPSLVVRAMKMLDGWHDDVMASATHPVDPLDTVLAEGGPKHVRGELPAYLERLRNSERGDIADKLEAQYPEDCK